MKHAWDLVSEQNYGSAVFLWPETIDCVNKQYRWYCTHSLETRTDFGSTWA
jgi:hypothetical protein